MNVLLIDGLSEKSGQVNLGLGFLAQYIRKDHNVRIMALPYHEIDEFADAAADADVVGVSSLTDQYPDCLAIARRIKERFPDKPIVFGGVHPTAMFRDVLREEAVDYICRSEAELSFSKLLERLESGSRDVSGIPGLAYVDETGEIQHSNPEFVSNLDEVGEPAWDLLERERTSTRKRNVITSRGCPYTCTYCYNSTMRKSFRFKYRRRGVDSVIRECVMLKGEGANYINFSDDLFLVNKEWLAEFAAKWKEQVDLPFSCTARPEMVINNESALDGLKDAGLQCMWIGIESGSERIRRDIFNRKMSDESIINAFHIIRAHGLKSSSFNLVGVPTEGWREAFQTFAINLKARPDSKSHYTLMPYPDTEIWHMSNDMGLFIGGARTDFEDAGNVQAKGASSIRPGYLHTGKLNRFQVTALRHLWRVVFPDAKWWKVHKRIRSFFWFLFWFTRGLFAGKTA